MLAANILYLPEDISHDWAIETLHAKSFGPGRFARAATRIREQGPHDRALSFVAMRGDVLAGSVRMTPVTAGEGRGLMLGPLAVSPDCKNRGIGRHLLRLAVDAAREVGHHLVFLVGDEPYYGPLGFARIPLGQVSMPRPVDPHRMLACELRPGALDRFRGTVAHASHAAQTMP